MNAVFTITSKNYLSRAFALGQSLEKNSNVDFYIMLADEMDNFQLEKEHINYNIIEFKQIYPTLCNEMAYKYDILEFNTSIKPFCFEYLFNQGYHNVIYFDPDIYTLDNVDIIFQMLHEKSIVLTPHVTLASENYNGCFSEENLLFVGVFNLGFTAIKNNAIGKKIVIWWENRLFKACYADKEDSLHTDQKWMDLIPSYFGDEVYICRDLGMNVAGWNIHERFLLKKNDTYYVCDRDTKKTVSKLIFFHFSGFDPEIENLIHKKQKKYTLKTNPEFKDIFGEYKKQLKSNGYSYYIHANYHYDYYANGTRITHQHRRIYRKLMENGYQFTDPFAIGSNTYYNILSKSGIVNKNKIKNNKYDKATMTNYRGFNKKDAILKKCFIILKTIVGIENYFLLMRWLKHIGKPENQIFLIAKELVNNKGINNE